MSLEIGASGLGAVAGGSVDALSGQIATGNRLNEAGTDPAGLGVNVELGSQVRGNNIAVRNSMDGISAVQVADSSVSDINDSLQRIRELTVQAGNGTLNSRDRGALQDEASQLLEGIRDSIGNSTFNDQSLLQSDGALPLQVGADAGETRALKTMDLATALKDAGLFDLDLTNPDTSDAFESLEDSLTLVGQLRSDFGAMQNSLDSGVNSLLSETLNESAARSRISDTDMAQAISERSREQIKEKVEITMLAQANAQRGQVLNLLQDI
ncbi:MAG: flagellin [Marinobacterium sp.]|nr:flagellin [Marinobacterium sp.]